MPAKRTKKSPVGGARPQKSAAIKRPTGESPSRKPPVETGESLAQRRRRAARILAGLKRAYGPATCALNHGSALELLIATILSAQSTDENINRLTPQLWAKYRSPGDYVGVPAEELEADIRSSGFFRNKAKSIRNACRIIVTEFGGQVPDSMGDLLRLPGVARKTANVVLGTWFGKNEGVVVDTHVGRLAQRLGLTWRARDDKDAVRIEQDLMELLPRQDWTYFSHAVIRHGRQVCAARKVGCHACPLAKFCPSAETFG